LVSDIDWSLFKEFRFGSGQEIHIDQKTKLVTYDSSMVWRHFFKDFFNSAFSLSVMAYFGFIYWHFNPENNK